MKTELRYVCQQRRGSITVMGSLLLGFALATALTLATNCCAQVSGAVFPCPPSNLARAPRLPPSARSAALDLAGLCRVWRRESSLISASAKERARAGEEQGHGKRDGRERECR